MSKFIHHLPKFNFNKIEVDNLINLSQESADLKNTFISKNETKDPIVFKAARSCCQKWLPRSKK